MTNTTYNVRKLTSEFAKDQQQQPQPQPSSSSSHLSSPSLFVQVPQYRQHHYTQQTGTETAVATVTETMYDELVSYVSSVGFEVLSQEPEPFHFGAATTATTESSALYFDQQTQPQSRPVVSLSMSAFAAPAATALTPFSSSMSMTSASCVPHHPVGHWTYAPQTQTQTPPSQAQTQAQNMMTRFFPISSSLTSPAVHQIHTPHPSIVAQQYRHNQQQQHYHFSSSPQQHYHHHHQQANDWPAHEDPTLSPLSQDLGLGGSLADLSDFDNNSPILSGYGAHDFNELLLKDEYIMGDNFVFESDSHFDFVSSLTSSTIIQQQQQQQQQSVPAPQSSTPATVMVITPHLPPFSPISPAAAAFVAAATPVTPSIHFHVSSPTSSPLSPPLVPYSPSPSFLIPSNLFQYTTQQASSSSNGGAASSSTPIVAKSSGTTKSTLKIKSRKRTQATPSSTPLSSSSSSSPSTPAPAAVISSIPYFDSNNEKRFRCAWDGCNQDFERHHNCKAHYSTHTGERHFKCDHTGCQSKSFRQKGDLTRHMRIHTNERPYACGGAGLGCEMAYGRCDQKAKHEKKCPCFLARGL